MPVYVQHIGTLVPENTYLQESICERMKSWVNGERNRRLVHHAYRNSGIGTRYSVLGDFLEGATDPLFRVGPDGIPVEPTTRARNDRFAQEARSMAVKLARRSLDQCPDVTPVDVTHVITVTCTGFSNPGLDYYIARDLNLRPDVQRYALGFMGCYAALPALRMAWQFCRADPSAVVLVMAVELCTLHLHFADKMDSLLANAIFADGAASALVTARKPPSKHSAFVIDGFSSALIPEGEKDITWKIGDKGFEITLSSYVPGIIGSRIQSLVQPALRIHGLSAEDIGRWAIHPGGKAIVDNIQNELRLRPEQVEASRSVLRNYGNMSSATILFVLKKLLETHDAAAGNERVFAIAFGPGLTVETAVLRLTTEEPVAMRHGV